MTQGETDDMETLRKALQTCLRALNDAPSFAFSAGANPLFLAVDRRGQARSYELAARIGYVLKATEPAAAQKAG